jgi:hypothetical protein
MVFRPFRLNYFCPPARTPETLKIGVVNPASRPQTGEKFSKINKKGRPAGRTIKKSIYF